MTFASYLTRPLVLLIFLAIVGSSGTLRAQDAPKAPDAPEVSESHLQAARVAIDALRATDEFDSIISEMAGRLKAELYQKNPDLQPMISVIVDETAIGLASRRADLEREAALAYAKVFTEEELNKISEFYNSSVGKKLLADGPIVSRELIKAADIWQAGIARDLAKEAGERIIAEIKKMQSNAEKPAEGGAAAESD